MARPRKNELPEEKQNQLNQLNQEIEVFGLTPLNEIIEEKQIREFIKKARKIKNSNENQILNMLITSFINDDIEFEERTILAVKKK